MKQPKRLTRAQKIFLGKKGFDAPGQFLLIEETEADLIMYDKGTRTQVTIPKQTKRRQR